MRIGIYSGTFDPVHKGHIAFALEACKRAKLDAVYFAPEIKPQRKQQCTHIAHRLAMLRLAVRSQPKLNVLELPDAHFTPLKTYGRIRALFPEDEIVLLIGEDLLEHMAQWSGIDKMLPHVELAVGLRAKHTAESAQQFVNDLPAQPKAYYFVRSRFAAVSSMSIRAKLIAHQDTTDTLLSIQRYAQKEWLYHDLTKPTK